MVSALAMALLVGLPSSSSTDPAALVAKLGSPRPAERDQAAEALEALGRRALPVLREARENPDSQVRGRAAELLDRIEASLLIKPTLVALDFQDQPAAEVVDAIAIRTGFRLLLEPPEDPAWRSLRLTVREPQPVTFWEALDRLGTAGLIRHHPGLPPSPKDRAPVVRLTSGSGAGPVSFSGPFRVNLVSIQRGHDLVFAPGGEEPPEDGEEPDLERFEVLAQVFAEPHLVISLNGPPKQLVARDDFDQDLVPPPPVPSDDMDGPPDDEPAHAVERGPGFTPGALSIVQFPIPLLAPDRPGTTIVRLEGIIPLQVAMRRPDPLKVSLAGAAGKTFQADGATLRFPEGRLSLENRTPLELFFKAQDAPDALTPDPEALPDGFPEPRPVDTLQNRVELVDAGGHPLAWSVTETEALDGGEVRVVLTLSLRNGKAVPAQLLYYGLVQSAIEIPFKFARVPMP